MTNSNRRSSRDDKSKLNKRFSNDSDSRKSTENFRKSKDYSDKPRFSKDKSEGGFKPRSNDYSDKPRFSKDKSEGGFKPRSNDYSDKPRFSKDKSEGGFKPRSNDYADKPRFSKRSDDHKSNHEGKRGYAKDFKKSSDDFKSRTFKREDGKFNASDSRPFRKRDGNTYDKSSEDKGERIAPTTRGRKNQKSNDDLIRLNRYISNAGICSRRKADELIEAGVISVNGAVVTELGHKVDPYKDEVRFNGELLRREKKVYVLLNKPKDYITTTDDPQERRTVMHLVDKATKERIYPVGRLDRNTTGLLLMTNDGELAEKLSHPRHGMTKIYHVELNRNLTQGDFNKIQFGIELEDGLIKPDSISYVAGASKSEIGIQIHSGKNRIVRRIFEHLGYDVVKLDRVVYGNLTKKDLPRGRWRYLEEKEIIQLKHML